MMTMTAIAFSLVTALAAAGGVPVLLWNADDLKAQPLIVVAPAPPVDEISKAPLYILSGQGITGSKLKVTERPKTLDLGAKGASSADE